MVDVEVVAELCRAVLAARRLGCRLVLVDPEPEVAELLALAGVDDVVDRHRCSRPVGRRHGIRRYLR